MENENSHKNSEEGVNRRQQYKNQKLQETNEIFYCQCGKNYLTFSALYLHARNKHSVKLTTKRNQSNCKVEVKDGKTYITYFTLPSSSSESFQIKLQKKEALKNQVRPPARQILTGHLQLISQYLSQEKYAPGCSVEETFHHFKTYFHLLETGSASENYDPTADITIFFNQFVMFYLPKYVLKANFRRDSQSQVEMALMSFWQWLKRNRLTVYDLIYTPSTLDYQSL